MSDEMKIAIWRIILDHVHRRAEGTSAQRWEAMLQYKFRLLKWMEAGGAGEVPMPLPGRRDFQWSLRSKIVTEIANHYSEAA